MSQQIVTQYLYKKRSPGSLQAYKLELGGCLFGELRQRTISLEILSFAEFFKININRIYLGCTHKCFPHTYYWQRKKNILKTGFKSSFSEVLNLTYWRVTLSFWQGAV